MAKLKINNRHDAFATGHKGHKVKASAHKKGHLEVKLKNQSRHKRGHKKSIA